MSTLSPQKEIIVGTLRDLQWHCGREWLDRIKDDRKRISELNETYMLEKGYRIVGQPCKGKICGRGDCPLFARKAEPIQKPTQTSYPESALREQILKDNQERLEWFDTYQPQSPLPVLNHKDD